MDEPAGALPAAADEPSSDEQPAVTPRAIVAVSPTVSERNRTAEELRTRIAISRSDMPAAQPSMRSRISGLTTFPILDRGRSGQISTCLGALTAPMRSFTN